MTGLPFFVYKSRRVRGANAAKKSNYFSDVRHVKKICQWHIFSADLGGYAAVAAIWILQHYQDARTPRALVSLRSTAQRPQSLLRKNRKIFRN